MTQIYNSSDMKYGVPTQIAVRLDEAGLSEIAEQLFFLHQQAYHANCELGILKTLGRVSEEFEEQLECAGCFFSCLQMTFVESILMNCAKLFDSKSDVNLYSLIEVCKCMTCDINDHIEHGRVGKDFYQRSRLLRHPLHSSEEHFHKEEVSRQRAFDELFQIPGHDSKDSSPVHVSIDLDDLLALYEKRLNGLSKKVVAVRILRNKLYAHNGYEALSFWERIMKDCLTYSDIEELLEFAFDITEELMAAISGVCYSRAPVNLGDVEGLLRFAKVGMKTIHDQSNSAL